MKRQSLFILIGVLISVSAFSQGDEDKEMFNRGRRREAPLVESAGG